MDEEKIENNDSENVEQNETVNETTLTVDDYNKLLEEKKALEEKNKQLYARVKKSSESKPLAEKQNTGIDQAEFTRLKLKVDYNISDPDALDFVMKNGGEEALKNPYIKKTIDNMLEQKKAEQAAEIGDSGKSDFEKKYSTEQLKSMSVEELEKILPHA